MLYKNLLIWIDDIIVFAPTFPLFLQALREFFQLVHAHNLKLNVKKGTLAAREMDWCGKIFDGEGIRHDPPRL